VVLDPPPLRQPEAIRELIVRAVRARGALTEYAIAEHWRPIWWLRRSAASVPPYVDSLVADGTLERLAIEDGGAPVVVEEGVELDRPRPTTAFLLSAFDNLLWEPRFGQRVLGFEHVIEMYKPAPKRRYGYYVLPFFSRDRIVGRAHLKSERGDGSLVVKALHLEPGIRRSRVLDSAFDRLSTGSGAPRASSGSCDEDRHRRQAPNRLQLQAFCKHRASAVMSPCSA